MFLTAPLLAASLNAGLTAAAAKRPRVFYITGGRPELPPLPPSEYRPARTPYRPVSEDCGGIGLGTFVLAAALFGS